MDKVELTPELLRELQLKQLDMLVYFRDFCEKNNLTFWLIGGGLIGALREGGFVPWDDDVDVMLPREDYEKLPALWREQGMDGRFRLLKTDDEVFTGISSSGRCSTLCFWLRSCPRTTAVSSASAAASCSGYSAAGSCATKSGAPARNT